MNDPKSGTQFEGASPDPESEEKILSQTKNDGKSGSSSGSPNFFKTAKFDYVRGSTNEYYLLSFRKADLKGVISPEKLAGNVVERRFRSTGGDSPARFGYVTNYPTSR